jgi:hypothetical protein
LRQPKQQDHTYINNHDKNYSEAYINKVGFRWKQSAYNPSACQRYQASGYGFQKG